MKTQLQESVNRLNRLLKKTRPLTGKSKLRWGNAGATPSRWAENFSRSGAPGRTRTFNQL